MTRCDGCGHCVDICPSDIMHIDTTYRRALNIEPNMCWECYACVKACLQFAIDCRGYADFAPLRHSVRVRREEDKATISWKIKFRNGREKNFVSPIRTTPWGSKSHIDQLPVAPSVRFATFLNFFITMSRLSFEIWSMNRMPLVWSISC